MLSKWKHNCLFRLSNVDVLFLLHCLSEEQIQVLQINEGLYAPKQYLWVYSSRFVFKIENR